MKINCLLFRGLVAVLLSGLFATAAESAGPWHDLQVKLENDGFSRSSLQKLFGRPEMRYDPAPMRGKLRVLQKKVFRYLPYAARAASLVPPGIRHWQSRRCVWGENRNCHQGLPEIPQTGCGRRAFRRLVRRFCQRSEPNRGYQLGNRRIQGSTQPAALGRGARVRHCPLARVSRHDRTVRSAVGSGGRHTCCGNTGGALFGNAFASGDSGEHGLLQ